MLSWHSSVSCYWTSSTCELQGSSSIVAKLVAAPKWGGQWNWPAQRRGWRVDAWSKTGLVQGCDWWGFWTDQRAPGRGDIRKAGRTCKDPRLAAVTTVAAATCIYSLAHSSDCHCVPLKSLVLNTAMSCVDHTKLGCHPQWQTRHWESSLWNVGLLRPLVLSLQQERLESKQASKKN